MGKRIDFSMGAQAMASGDYTGDVYEDRERDEARATLLPSISESHDRDRRESNVSHGSLGRTTSRDTTGAPAGWKLRRAGTMDSALRKQQSVHRNRFFPSRHSHDDEPSITDFDERMEKGMAGIPETTAENTPRGSASHTPHARIDPRSGLISPQAVRMYTDESDPSEMSSGGHGMLGPLPNAQGPALPSPVAMSAGKENVAGLGLKKFT